MNKLPLGRKKTPKRQGLNIRARACGFEDEEEFKQVGTLIKVGGKQFMRLKRLPYGWLVVELTTMLPHVHFFVDPKQFRGVISKILKGKEKSKL